jgi:hypothetical protein
MGKGAGHNGCEVRKLFPPPVLTGSGSMGSQLVHLSPYQGTPTDINNSVKLLAQTRQTDK